MGGACPAGFDLVCNPNNFRDRFNAEPKAGGVYLADEVQVNVLGNVQQWSATYKATMPDMPRFVTLQPEGPLIPANGQYGSTGYTEWSDGHANPYWWARNGAGGDWLAEDPYPLFHPESQLAPYGYSHFWVADRAAHTVRAAQLNGLVPVTVVQLCCPATGGRFITPEELWSHMVMVVAEGARGIAWWEIGRGQGVRGQPDSIRIPIDDALKAITLLLRDLEPIILSDPNPTLLIDNSTDTHDPVTWRTGVLDLVAVAIQSYNYGAGGRATYVAEKNALLAGVTDWSPMLDQGSDVRTRVWEDANGIGYVFAYNYHPLAKPGVALTWYKDLQSVEVLGEDRMITPNGASWTDDYGSSTSLNMAGLRIGHIYKLTPVDAAPPVALSSLE